MNRVHIELAYKINSVNEMTGQSSEISKSVMFGNGPGSPIFTGMTQVCKSMEELMQRALADYKAELNIKDPEKCCKPGDECKCND